MLKIQRQANGDVVLTRAVASTRTASSNYPQRWTPSHRAGRSCWISRMSFSWTETLFDSCARANATEQRFATVRLTSGHGSSAKSLTITVPARQTMRSSGLTIEVEQ